MEESDGVQSIGSQRVRLKQLGVQQSQYVLYILCGHLRAPLCRKMGREQQRRHEPTLAL